VSLGAVVGLALAMASAEGPSAFWRHAGIGAGRAVVSLTGPNALEAARRLEQLNVLWEADGIESSVALMAIGPGLSFVLNGKADGNARGDAATVVMGGLVGAALHPQPRRSLVIGLGAGSTAGWLASVPGMERTDVIELEPNMVRVARMCAPVNQDLLANPRVHVVLGDAREALLVSRQSYDIVFSEPSNPYRAGIASLFTREYYEAVARRLAPHGYFLQWLQTYEVDLRTVASVYATLRTAFPYVETWQVGDSDLLLMAARDPIVYDVRQLRARLAQEPFRAALRVAWQAEGVEGFFAFLVGRATFSDYLVGVTRGQVSTDDRNEIEFGFARTVGSHELNVLTELRQAAAQRGEDLPMVAGAAIDWRRLNDARVSHVALMSPAQGRTLVGPMAAVMRAHLHGDDAGFLAGWRALGREPEDPLERRLLAGHLSALGDESALVYIARVAQEDPTTAALLEALLRVRQRRPEAVDLICRCLDRMRSDPWLQTTDSPLAVALAGEIGRLFPFSHARLVRALAEPFALHAQDDLRRDTLLGLASAALDSSDCATVLGQVERRVPWSEKWLTYRERCYRANMGSRWHEAQAEVARFRHNETQHLLSPPRGENAAPGL
jgi:spermidine synthase